MVARTRSRGYPAETAEINYNDSDGKSVLETKPVTVAYLSEVTSDVVVKNYKKKIANGAIINNPFSYSKNLISHDSGSATYSILNYKNDPNFESFSYTLSGDLTAKRIADRAPVFPSLDPLAVDSLITVKQKALAKMDSSDYNFGEDALELRETLLFLKNTLEFIKSPLAKVNKIAQKIQRKGISNMRAGMNAADASKDAYLQYRFAMTPLVRSVMDAIDAYQKNPSVVKPRYFARSASKDSDSTSSNVVVNDSSFTRNVKREETVRATIMYEVSNPNHDWRFQLGLRNKDIAATLWAVAPLSFMVDRLIDISSTIKGIQNLADPRITILAASYSTKTVSETTTVVVEQSSEEWSRSGSGGELKHTSVSYSRTPWVPNVFDTFPTVTGSNVIKDATSVLDLIAISTNFLSTSSWTKR